MDDYGVVFIVVIERRLIKRPRTFYLYKNVGSFPFLIMNINKLYLKFSFEGGRDEKKSFFLLSLELMIL